MNPKKNLFLYLFLIISLLITLINTASEVYSISDEVSDDNNYNKADFSTTSGEQNYYFKYSFSSPPESRIGAFRFDFDQFDQSTTNKEVLCTFVDASATNDQIITTLNAVTKDTSSCIGAFHEIGIYDGIFEYDKSKKLFVMLLKTNGELEASAHIYLRKTETSLSPEEQEVKDSSKYSLIPYMIHISNFRSVASKVLFYSKTRDLQMYYVEADKNYPERLFFGNVMSVYTNPNMVRQKYKNANTMILLTRPFDAEEIVGEQLIFQVKLFKSDYLLDYYMGTNPDGREKNSPLAINMTECSEPYYVILNYNKPEKKVSLYIDEIYGKIKNLSVAPTFSSSKWEDMITKDFKPIDINERKYELPANSRTHMDVYKVECEVPLLLNFYYVDETARIPDLSYGQVVISTLKANKIVSLPVSSEVSSPKFTIEVYNPTKNPFIIVNTGNKEFIINKNSIVETTMMNSVNSLVIKERGGDANTRVIVKVGYDISKWEKISDNIKHDKTSNIYVFSFPSNINKYNYTYSLLETSGTNKEDNVKYCYGTNIGIPILPSSENCYRVSKDNSYTIKIMNPLVMYKDYDSDVDLVYYVSMKPMNTDDTFTVKENLVSYDAKARNFEGQANVIQLTSSTESTILSYLKSNEEKVFYQITSCDGSEIKYGIYNAYSNEQIVNDQTIPQNKQNYFSDFTNTFGEMKLKLSGNTNNKIFVKHNGVSNSYQLNLKSSFPITFDQSKNAIIFSRPLTNSERLTYTVYVAKDGLNGVNICSFINTEKPIAAYSRNFSTYSDGYVLPINFHKVGLKEGDGFQAIAYIEQDLFSKMSFVSNLLTGTVGKIKEETITEINTEESSDKEYVSLTQEVTETSTLYYSFKNDQVFDVPVGLFRIEIDSQSEGGFNTPYCAWVDDGADAISMVEAVEEVVDNYNSFCTGGKDKYKPKVFNYIFRYSYTSDNKPRRMVIKIPEVSANTKFKIYIRKGENTYIKQTDFNTLEKYGNSEEFKLSRIAYILDLAKIRGDDSQTDYVSKVLFYSQYFEMQMYTLKEESNSPQVLFTGNVMLVYTKPSLAEQKYFGTKLILLSEYIRGQEHSGVVVNFRFHTKMFRSYDQIEYFVSANPFGRTLNFPLSIEMNTCNGFNKNFYYILNYNKEEEKRNLYIDLIFGSMNTAKIVTDLSVDNWDQLISEKMEVINNYYTSIPERSTHIDIVEIKCITPLLANIYYNYDDYPYDWVTQGNVVIKNIDPGKTFTFYLDTSSSAFMYYSVEIFDPTEAPDVMLQFKNSSKQEITKNSLSTGILFTIPDNVFVQNNGNSITRFIFKVGFEVDNSWNKDSGTEIFGTVFSNGNKKVYKFPSGLNKLNFTNVEIKVMPTRKDPPSENVKFCYSTSLGMPIDTSQENCFRTGERIPYTLTFVNPLISPKNYKRYSDYYYVTIIPQGSDNYLSLEVTENKYETKDRNLEGFPKVITLENEKNKSTILSIPEDYTNNKYILQMKVCIASSRIINYNLYNAYTEERITTGNISPDDKIDYYEMSNNLMEVRLEFVGEEKGQEKIFVKHSGLNEDYNINIYEGYSSTFDESVNIVTIIKPILDEEFVVTVIVGEKGQFDNFNLCTFIGISQEEFKKLGKYVKSFTSSEKSEKIDHYIDFRSFKYEVGKEFDLIVYAVQTKNSKLEFLYPVISGVVGSVEHTFTEINGAIESDVISLNYKQKTVNYFYYDFQSNPVGDAASLKIVNEGEVTVKVTKVICTFVEEGTSDLDMADEINKVAREGPNLCKGNDKKNANGIDALINASNVKNKKNRLVIMVQYGLGDDELKDDVELLFNLRVTGFDVSKSDTEYNQNEDKALVPYVFDLTKIRGSAQKDYISKVLIYSNKRELEMFHFQDDTPTQLFTGNILLVFTNKEVINEKYSGATTMILLTESLRKEHDPIIGEKFRFKTYFFKSDNTMQYFVSSNEAGRPINIPITMEMPSCDKPYYYILNYHMKEEKDLSLHIDQIYGELSSKKIATRLNQPDWYQLIADMDEINGDEYLLDKKDNYHMDVVEVTCIIPSLLQFYYTDNQNPIIENIAPGSTTIISLAPTVSKELQIQSTTLEGYNFVFSFNVEVESNDPNIIISFPLGNPLTIKKNGIYTKKSEMKSGKIVVKNEEISGTSKVRVIFKYGYEIENNFEKIENEIYHKKSNETGNLFGYIFKTEEDWLNYTSVSFMVSTTEENVKFCYSTNLGSFMEPASQDCYRVGVKNTYTLDIINPYLMSTDYITEINEDKMKTLKANEIMKYYVGFKTVDINQNITIKPTLNKYKTLNRNMEDTSKSIPINKFNSTILTPPQEKSEFIFLQMQVCTENQNIDLEFYNAFNMTSLYMGDNIDSLNKYYYITIPNTKLDTLINMTINTDDRNSKMYVRHVGADDEYYPIVNEEFSLKFDREKDGIYNLFTISQPISEQSFNYTVYIDMSNSLKNKANSLCFTAENNKLAHFSISVISAEEEIKISVDFVKEGLKDYKEFDAFVVAKQLNEGKMEFLSNVIQDKAYIGDEGNNNIELIITIVVLSVILICGGIVIFICLKRYKNKPASKKLDAKQTSLAMVDNENDKMIMSTASEKPD